MENSDPLTLNRLIAERQEKLRNRILLFVSILIVFLCVFYTLIYYLLFPDPILVLSNLLMIPIAAVPLFLLFRKKIMAARNYIFYVYSGCLAVWGVLWGVGDSTSVYFVFTSILLIPFFWEESARRLKLFIYLAILYLLSHLGSYLYTPAVAFPYLDTFLLVDAFIVFILFIVLTIVLYRAINVHLHLVHTQNTELEEMTGELKDLNTAQHFMFSVIAHDLKNYSSMLYTLTHHLYAEHNQYTDGQTKDMLKVITDTASAHKELVQNLLEWSASRLRQKELVISVVSASRVVRSVVRVMKPQMNEKNLKIESSVDDAVKVCADENALSAIIRNLVSNAVKFSPDHSTIKIEAHPEDSFIRFSVTDSGEGMDINDVKILFTSDKPCLLYTSPSPRDRTRSRMPSSA